MTTYICSGYFESFSFTLGESWHDLDSIFDSTSGRSPIVQLARVVNDLSVALGRPNYTFPVIGTDLYDLILSEVDYESNPESHPLSDAIEIVTRCYYIMANSITVEDYTVEEIDSLSFTNAALCSEDGLFRQVNAPSIRQEMVASASPAYKDKFRLKHIILAIRKALEDIQLVTQAYVFPLRPSRIETGFLTIYRQLVVVGKWLYPIEVDYERGANDPAAIFRTTWDPPPLKTEVRFGNGSSWAHYNKWKNRAIQCSGYSGTQDYYYTVSLGVGASFRVWQPVLTSPDGAYYAFRVPDPYCNNLMSSGWQTKKEMRATYRIEKTIHYPFGLTEEEQENLLDELEGETVNWTATISGSPDVEYTVTPGLTGSFVWGPGEHFKDIDFKITLVDINGELFTSKYMGFHINNNQFDRYFIGRNCEGDHHVCFDLEG